MHNPMLSLIPEISGTSMYVYSNENFLPRGYFVKNTRVISNAMDRLNFMNSVNFSPGDEVILHDALDLNIDFSGEKTVKLKEFKPGYVRWNLQSSTSSLFVISESYYEPGWKAYLNGILVPLHKANHIQMALVIPEGQHELILEFAPEAYYQFATLEKVILYSLYLFIFIHGFYRYRKRMPFFVLSILSYLFFINRPSNRLTFSKRLIFSLSMPVIKSFLDFPAQKIINCGFDQYSFVSIPRNHGPVSLRDLFHLYIFTF